MSNSEVGRKFTFWVVYDATSDRQFVKMDSDTGCLAMFDTEESAAAFASGLFGVDYKEVVLYQQSAPDAAVLIEALSRYESIRDSVGGCGDHGCLIKKPSGMATNGGCRCLRDPLKTQRMMMAAHELFNRLTVVCKQGGES